MHIRPLTAFASAVVCIALVLAGTWIAPRVSGAVATWMKAPPVRARTLAVDRLGVAAVPAPPSALGSAAAQTGAAGAETQIAAEAQAAAPDWTVQAAAVTLDPGMRFTMIGVTARPPASGRPVLVWLRAGDDGHTWGAWSSAELERGGDGEAASPRAFTEPVWTGLARYVQVAAASPAAAPAVLRDVKVVAINSDGDATPADALVGMVRHVGALVAGIDLTPAAMGMTTTPTIVTRAAWGANESWRSGSPSFAPVKMAFVHHTADSNGYSRSESAGVVRGVYYYHTKALGWSDIGYNFLIDRYGVIYEGRYGGMKEGPIGAQVLGFNTGSTGISIMGNFVHASVPAAAVTSLKALLAWKLDVHHIDPQGTAVLTCGYGQKFATGQRVTFPAIAGHRQANFTACPGDHLYSLLPGIRAAVAGIGLPKIYALSSSEADLSPDGDGVKDKTDLAFTVSESADWTLTVKDAAGTTVRTFAGTGADVAVGWAGKDDGGRTLPDGVYKVAAAAATPSGTARAAVTYVRLDTVPPQVKAAEVAPETISPNGDGADDTASLRYTPGEACEARVSLLDANGNAVRSLSGWHAVTAGPHAASWNGKITVGGSLQTAPEGKYGFELSLRDLAGNVASVRRAVTVDLTLGFAMATPVVISPNGDGVKDTSALGFKLTRTADVRVQITKDGTVVRTIDAGRPGKGDGAVTWDGKLSGAFAPSGAYRFIVTADGKMGASSVSGTVKVDLYRPRLTVPATASVKLGKTARIGYSVRDPYSSSVKVWAVVTDAAGATVATVRPGWVKPATPLACSWRPSKRGTYTVAFHAVDRGGNEQSTTAQTTLTVR
jgi:flagellar hook assembly protein FlgD